MRTEQLAKRIARLCPRDGSHETAMPGLYLTRASTKNLPRTSLNCAVFCVVAQGAKSTLVEGRRHRYDSSKYLIVSLDLPLVGQIEEASSAKPFLGLSLVLDFAEIRTVMDGMSFTPSAAGPGLAVNVLDDDLLDAVIRLVKTLSRPSEIPLLGPLIRREIYCRLLLSRDSGLLRRMVSDNGKVERIAAGLDWLRRNAAKPIRMAELAREVHMSVSTMYSSFREVTSMSPLQFQKQLRLQEARRMLLSGGMDANTASRRVGYESASQFSREYRRFFGASPMQDVERLRTLPMPEAGERV